MNRLGNLAARIDEFSVRERGLIMITGLVLLYLVWQAWLMAPLNDNKVNVSSRISDTTQEIAALNLQAQTIVQRQSNDPDEKNRKEIARLEARLAGLQDELAELTVHLIAPEDMASVLESVLQSSADVQFIALKGLGSTALLDSGVEQSEEDANSETQTSFRGAFKHGLKLEVEGGYLQTLDMLRKLESLPWVFFWESVDLQVGEYPTSHTAITVFTLSWNREWIGI